MFQITIGNPGDRSYPFRRELFEDPCVLYHGSWSTWSSQIEATGFRQDHFPFKWECVETICNRNRAIGRGSFLAAFLGKPRNLFFASNFWLARGYATDGGGENGQAVDVFIYASHAPGDLDLKISWLGRYIGHQPSVAGAHPDGMRFRPDSTQKYQDDNAGHWAVFWELDQLKEIDGEQRMDITDLISFRTGKRYPASPPEGPMLIEHP